MTWTPGRPAPAAAPPEAEARLWTLIKTGRSASPSVRAHPLGRELIVRVRGDLLWSRVIRPGDDTTPEAEAAITRAEFEGLGWVEAEV